jgi:hypothetical protein
MASGEALQPRERKFRQAAFVYLHVGLLYEFAAYAMWRADMFGDVPGHPLLWLAMGAGIVALVFWGLWYRQSVWFARFIWLIHGFRLPAMIDGAFLRAPGEGAVPSELYLFAIIVILINLWMLARAGWDV